MKKDVIQQKKTVGNLINTALNALWDFIQINVKRHAMKLAYLDVIRKQEHVKVVVIQDIPVIIVMKLVLKDVIMRLKIVINFLNLVKHAMKDFMKISVIYLVQKDVLYLKVK